MRYKANRAQVVRSKPESRQKRRETQAIRGTEEHRSGHLHTRVSADMSPFEKKAIALRGTYVESDGSHRIRRGKVPKPPRRPR